MANAQIAQTNCTVSGILYGNPKVRVATRKNSVQPAIAAHPRLSIARNPVFKFLSPLEQEKALSDDFLERASDCVEKHSEVTDEFIKCEFENPGLIIDPVTGEMISRKHWSVQQKGHYLLTGGTLSAQKQCDEAAAAIKAAEVGKKKVKTKKKRNKSGWTLHSCCGIIISSSWSGV